MGRYRWIVYCFALCVLALDFFSQRFMTAIALALVSSLSINASSPPLFALSSVQSAHEKHYILLLEFIFLLALQLPVRFIDEDQDSGPSRSSSKPHSSLQNSNLTPSHLEQTYSHPPSTFACADTPQVIPPSISSHLLSALKPTSGIWRGGRGFRGRH